MVLFALQVVCHGPENIKFVGLQKTHLPYKLLSLMVRNVVIGNQALLAIQYQTVDVETAVAKEGIHTWCSSRISHFSRCAVLQRALCGRGLCLH